MVRGRMQTGAESPLSRWAIHHVWLIPLVVSAGWLFLSADSRVLPGDRLSAARPEYGCVDGISLDSI